MILVNFWSGLQHAIGADNAAGPVYLAWSGIVGDITIFTGFITAIIMIYRKHNCQVKNCKRIGKHSVEGTPYIVCKKHHPELPEEDVTYTHIVLAHKRAKIK